MALVLVLLFIVLPIAEIYVIIKVGEAIGVWPTIALLILDGFLDLDVVDEAERDEVEAQLGVDHVLERLHDVVDVRAVGCRGLWHVDDCRGPWCRR